MASSGGKSLAASHISGFQIDPKTDPGRKDILPGLPSACEQVRTSCGQEENGKGEGQNHKKLWNNFVDFFRKMRII